MHPLLDPARHIVIGHRGAAAEAPENTLPSFARALEAGADALELDVRVTADGVPIVMHDPTLDRTTDRSGTVASLSWEEVRTADAGARFSGDGGESLPFRDRGLSVPTLAEVLQRFPDTPLVVELKEACGADRVKAVLEQHGAAERGVLGSFDAAALEPFRTGGFLLGAGRGEVARLLVGSLVGLPPRRVGYSALTIPLRHRGLPVVTNGLLRAARRLGCPVHVWTVDDPSVAQRLWERGVIGIITNDPAAMVRVRGEVPLHPLDGEDRR